MTERLLKIFSEIQPCEVFADIGCDHGYMAKAMLCSGKCKKVIVSDVSAKCLKKAEELLSDYINQKRAESVVSDGFDNVGECDLALIAGMGGEEIVSILKRAKNLPEKLVLQPMKNTDKVRRCVLQLGYAVKKDYVFFSSGIFYDLLVLEKGEDYLTEEEIEFGKTNVNSPSADFKKMITVKMEKLQEYLLREGLKEDSKKAMLLEIKKLKNYV